MSIDDRTTKALGPDVMKQLKTLHFCIVGCGGTGANFAEMLVRTGATQLTLIDGTEVKESSLNRVSSYCKSDRGQHKVEALKERLEAIRTDVDVRTLPDSFRAQDDILSDYPKGHCVRDAVYNADVVFIGTDTNRSRIAIEELCRTKTGDSTCRVAFWWTRKRVYSNLSVPGYAPHLPNVWMMKDTVLITRPLRQ